MSTTNVAGLTQLAQVDSANVFYPLLLGAPQILLEVVAQRSGFNWELKVQPGIPDPEPLQVEYFPYLVLETKIGPDWSKRAGIGPVVPSTTLYTWATHVGSKGIEVIGRDFRKKFDLAQSAAA
ncbi:MAG TPA: hypothetical protein VE685_11685 [Thermoanaerobaculia bacterium]|nr:hypothetical protein [Thermoanaerobaculia bacterium]